MVGLVITVFFLWDTLLRDEIMMRALPRTASMVDYLVIVCACFFLSIEQQCYLGIHTYSSLQYCVCVIF